MGGHHRMRIARRGVLACRVERRYLVTTDHGEVLVRIDAERGGLDPELLILEAPDAANTAELQATVPLRAFGAKMVELIEMQGGDMPGGERLRRLLVQEKASADLNRIERWARERADA
jgi:hypothetical protein